MNLVIDLGNTQNKYAVFDNDKIIESWRDHITRISYWNRKLKTLPEVKLSILSTVFEGNLLTIIKKSLTKKLTLIELNHTTPVPINNKYKTPKTLGNDRLANAVGATVVFPKKNVLVIDMGTCIKYDFIDKKKNYLGGAISPGFEMRFKALKHYTAKLPLVKPGKKFSLTGKNTQESILSGVQNGIIFEINGMIEQYKKKYDELKVILTGGDHSFFADHLKSSIFAAPNLTLQGLNEILNYNVRKKS
jgi:type III pantothenate kinase